MHAIFRTAGALLITGLLLASSPATAWNAAGHRLTAAIAWRQMDGSTRERLGELLAHHPDYQLWLKRSSSLEPAYAAFLEASTWPDDIKRDKRFHDTDEPPTPLLPGFSDMGRHRNWHYVDHAVGRGPGRNSSAGALDTRLAKLMQSVGDNQHGTPGNNSQIQRAIALAWLTHLAGDAHQPLHVVSRYDEDGHSDEGGNALRIENPFHPRRSSMTLHAYWDDLPGPPWLRGERLESAASALFREGRGNSPGTIKQWIGESQALAKAAAYDGLEGEVPTITAEYHERALKTAGQRVALAGRRLGLLLEKLLSP
jgi:hypothetical protein